MNFKKKDQKKVNARQVADRPLGVFNFALIEFQVACGATFAKLLFFFSVPLLLRGSKNLKHSSCKVLKHSSREVQSYELVNVSVETTQNLPTGTSSRIAGIGTTEA